MGAMELVAHVVAALGGAQTFTYVVVGALTVFAGTLMLSQPPVAPYALIYTPTLAAGGLIAVYAARMHGFLNPSDAGSGLVLAATGGMILALLVALCLTRLCQAVGVIRRPVTRSYTGIN